MNPPWEGGGKEDPGLGCAWLQSPRLQTPRLQTAPPSSPPGHIISPLMTSAVSPWVCLAWSHFLILPKVLSTLAMATGILSHHHLLG